MSQTMSIVPLINAAGQTLVVVAIHKAAWERMERQDPATINLGGLLDRFGIKEINISFELILTYEPDEDAFTEEVLKRAGDAKALMDYVCRGWTNCAGDKRPDLFISRHDLARGGLEN